MSSFRPIVGSKNRSGGPVFSWITSVPGVGSVTAMEVLVATDEFKAINDPKKLACHAGVAPFDRVAGAIPVRK